MRVLRDPDEAVIVVLDGLAGTDALTHLRPDDGGSKGRRATVSRVPVTHQWRSAAAASGCREALGFAAWRPSACSPSEAA